MTYEQFQAHMEEIFNKSPKIGKLRRTRGIMDFIESQPQSFDFRITALGRDAKPAAADAKRTARLTAPEPLKRRSMKKYFIAIGCALFAQATGLLAAGYIVPGDAANRDLRYDVISGQTRFDGSYPNHLRYPAGN
jgi:hypothetical protein